MSVKDIDIRNQTAAMVHYHMRRSVISIGRPDNLMTEITWKTICRSGFMVVWCQKWEFRAFVFGKIPPNPILYNRRLVR